jgi:signal transduction histidine kinase
MIGNFWLDWLTLSISIFNTIIMLWMGLMILLSTDKRTPGVWLASGGLLFGALFFVSHTAIIGQEISFFTSGTNFWWHIGWGPVVAVPFVWYIVMLWFAGYWDHKESDLRKRQKSWLNITIVYALLLVILVIFLNPLGTLSPKTSLDYETGPAFSGIPLLFIAYPIYIFLCITLSMEALLKPGPTERFFGEMAREKARPWLVGAGFILLLVSIIVGYAIISVLQNAQNSSVLPELYGNIAPTLGVMDLIISLLISTVVLLVGQAVVSYGIFTGKPMPLRVFKRQWMNVIIMAAIVAIIFAASIKIQLRMIYSLLLAIILLAVFFSWITWRYLIERELAIQRVRPFLNSPNLLQTILNQSQSPQDGLDIITSFNALVQDVLDTDRAILSPLGGIPTLMTEPIFSPEPTPIPEISSETIVQIKSNSQAMGYPLDVEESKGFTFLIPLWSERGLNGLLYLGKKRDDSFFSQEEIELARAASERLLDISVSAELSSRLIKLQQQRFIEQSVIDQRPRRVLHDDVLPALHTAMLSISGSYPDSENAVKTLSEAHRIISNLLKEMPSTFSPQFAHIGLLQAIRKLVTQEFSNSFSRIELTWTDHDEERIAKIPQIKKEVMYYAAREVIRNSTLHAVPGNVKDGLQLMVSVASTDDLELIIQDNGSGVDQTDGPNSGTGQGLIIHGTLMALVGGTLNIQSSPGQFTRITLKCPL